MDREQENPAGGNGQDVLVHQLEITHGEEKRMVTVKIKGQTAQDCKKKFIIFGHRSWNLIIAILSDSSNQQIPRVEIPLELENPTNIRDFFIIIYGVDTSGKIVEECSTGIDIHDLSDNMFYNERVEIWKREIQMRKYTLHIQTERKESILLLTEKSTGEKHLLQRESGLTTYTIPFSLKPATDYVVQAFSGSCIGPLRYSLCAYAHLEFRTAMLQIQVQLLYNRATEFCISARCYEINYIYRNKPSFYFSKILTRGGGIMTKYIKNDGGDQASPLNRSIKGLFFSCYFKQYADGRPHVPINSPFGDRRLHIRTSFFINIFRNLYFADFFCHSRNHHITLVVTQPNNDSDKFCRKHLKAIDKTNNPFLFYDVKSNRFLTTTSINIEVFFTENIDIQDLLHRNVAFFSSCSVWGNSKVKSFMGGKKNENCKLCNLNPDEIVYPESQ